MAMMTVASKLMLGRLAVPTLSCCRRHAPRHLGLAALGLLSFPPASAAHLALCSGSRSNDTHEDSTNTPSILDTIFPKDGNGKIYWDKASKQVTEAVFWDKLAKATGQKVRYVHSQVSTGLLSGQGRDVCVKRTNLTRPYVDTCVAGPRCD